MDRWPRRISPTTRTLLYVLVVLLLSLVVMGVNRGVTVDESKVVHLSTAFTSDRVRERTAPFIEITCPKCDGHGTIGPSDGNPLTSDPCDLCKATGRIKFPRKNPPCCRGTSICSSCDGNGKVRDGRGSLLPCKACQGNGICGGWIYNKKLGLISRPCLKNR